MTLRMIPLPAPITVPVSSPVVQPKDFEVAPVLKAIQSKIVVKEFPDGIIINGSFPDPEVMKIVNETLGGKIGLTIIDFPYGNIVKDKYDKYNQANDLVTEMIVACKIVSEMTYSGGALYTWGGIGRPNFRPLYKFLASVEETTNWTIADHITWRKRRARGTNTSYLFIREELIYMTLGDPKKPRKFEPLHLDIKRGYAGWDKNHPAKSEYFRRGNVWDDINEIFKNKKAEAQKPQRLHEIPIEVHTFPGEFVFDPYAGTGTTAKAARKLNRKFVLIEKDPVQFDIACDEVENYTGD